jgi:GT2 family glycosyltransferase
MKVAIITVNYNAGEKLYQTLQDRFENTGIGFDQYVVDSGSTDGSFQIIKKRWPKVRLIDAKKNVGFGRANNLALERIVSGQDGQYEYVVLANPDMLHKKGWLQQLLKTIEKSEKIAAVNPLILYTDKFNVVKAATNNTQIYLYNQDYRFLANLIGKESSNTKEITLREKQYIQPNSKEFQILINDKNKSFEIEIYNEALRGFQLNLGGQTLGQGQLQSFIKKLGYKLKLASIDSKFFKYKFNIEDFELVRSSVEVINAFGTGIRKGKQLPENHYYGQFREDVPQGEGKVDLWYGACVLLKVSALKKIGLFDPGYFMYYEESDLAMQMREAGYEFIATSDSIVYHMEKYAYSEHTIDYLHESEKRFVKKWGAKARALAN